MDKIKLLFDVSVGEEHGLFKDRVFTVVRTPVRTGWSGVHWWVMSDAGEEVGIKSHEAELITDDS